MRREFLRKGIEKEWD